MCEVFINFLELCFDVVFVVVVLINKYYWFIDKIIEVLLDVLFNDSEKWNWVINNCI